MEKIEADIFNILHNTKIRLQGDAEDNYGFMGKGYAEKLAVEIVKEIQPSEKKALSVEKLMDIIDLSAGFNIGKNNRWLIAQAIFDALPTQKALRENRVKARDEIYDWMHGVISRNNIDEIITFILERYALPAQREVSG